MYGYSMLVAAIAIFIFSAYYGIKFSAKQGSNWIVLAEGRFSSVIFDRKLSSRRGGAAFYTNAQNFAVTARIRFYDGTWCEAYGISEILAERGEMIRVWQNGHGDCKVEKILEDL